MSANAQKNVYGGGSRLRKAVWIGTGFILLIPAVAMLFTNEVNWSPGDFFVAGALLIGTGLAFELTVRKAGSKAYRAAMGLALAAALLLVWVNGAVGIIGSENNDLNLMYAGVLAVAIVGAILARFQSQGMARTMLMTALAQAVVAVLALLAGYFTLPVDGFFVALWLVSARLFQIAPEGDLVQATG